MRIHLRNVVAVVVLAGATRGVPAQQPAPVAWPAAAAIVIRGVTLIDDTGHGSLARCSAVASLERGETRLAAYRSVLSPPAAHASLIRS